MSHTIGTRSSRNFPIFPGFLRKRLVDAFFPIRTGDGFQLLPLNNSICFYKKPCKRLFRSLPPACTPAIRCLPSVRSDQQLLLQVEHGAVRNVSKAVLADWMLHIRLYIRLIPHRSGACSHPRLRRPVLYGYRKLAAPFSALRHEGKISQKQEQLGLCLLMMWNDAPKLKSFARKLVKFVKGDVHHQ